MEKWRDAAFKLFWTVANTGLAAVLAELVAGEQGPLTLVLIAVVQLASSFVRQKVGEQPA